MKKSARMQVLVNLAQREEDKVSELVANERKKVDLDKQKLQDLKSYAEQYDQERNLLGMSSHLAVNYQHFVDRLQQAIHQQEGQVSRSEQQYNMAMRRWQAARAKTKGMDWLKDKSIGEEERVEEKLEQARNDEFATRKFFDNNR
ncbi:flagellar export protein FliJ [Marinomonas balearica]|uniref:Flagellar FliJ protein n=1 Tax=Marinomonas balearica TaxID=491947 RepID=A0A4R6M9U3_9GAMM|nr:flagellar export protein FliJ [Marinomonas balearica]TDO98291.1 flagellar FliJ protein [Marinomonas balearica]